MKPTLSLLATGVANTASVVAAFDRLGARCRPVDSAREVEQAERLVLPGVGAFRPAMERLRSRSLVEPLRERLDAGRPTLAICLGLQLLGRGSDECPGTAGLGAIDRVARRLPDRERLPHLGWNRVEAAPGSGWATGEAYFAHSYRWTSVPDGWEGATCTYGGPPFVAAVRRGSVVAFQFHPELSGTYGAGLLDAWLATEVLSC